MGGGGRGDGGGGDGGGGDGGGTAISCPKSHPKIFNSYAALGGGGGGARLAKYLIIYCCWVVLMGHSNISWYVLTQ